MLTTELYESPQKGKNEYKYSVSGDQCICCMKPITSKNVKHVHMNTNWVAVSNDVTDENCEELTGSESQGLFAIGNSCAKKMPKNFIS